MRGLIVGSGILLIAGVGCAGSVTGEVDGKALGGVQSSAFIQPDIGDNFMVSAAGVSVMDACGGTTRFLEERKDIEETFHDDLDDAESTDDADDAKKAYAEALTDLSNDKLPKDFWSIGVAVGGEDDGDIEDDFKLGDDDPAFFSVCFHEGEYDYDDEDLTDGGADCFGADNGDITVEKFEKDGTIVISGEDIDLVDEDGDDQGNIEKFSMTASYCEGWEKAQQDITDIWTED